MPFLGIWISIFAALLFAPSAQALLCEKSPERYMCRPHSDIEQTKIELCKAEMKAGNCEGWFDLHPDAVAKARHCESQATCPMPTRLKEYALGCVDGSADGVIAKATAIVRFVVHDYKKMPDMVERDDYFNRCTDTECKYAMLGPYAQSFSKIEIEGCKNLPPETIGCEGVDKLNPDDPVNQSKLKGLTAAVLYRKLLEKLRIQAENKSMSDAFIEPWSGNPAAPTQSIDDLIAGVLGKAGIHNTACYDPVALWEMRCFALAMVLDPLALTAAGLANISKLAGLSKAVVKSIPYDVKQLAAMPGRSIKAFARSSVKTRFPIFEKYPALTKRIDGANSKILKEWPGTNHVTQSDLGKQAAKYAKLPEPLIQQRLKDLDPEITSAMVGVQQRLNDNNAFANYMEKLSADAVANIEKRGVPSELTALQKGEISSDATLRVLIERAQKRDEGVFSAKPSSNVEFREAVKQGPFLDHFFMADGSHGISTHLIQRDFVSDVVNNATKGQPEKFWSYLGTKKGVTFWTPLFDSGEWVFRPALRNPETTKRYFQEYMPAP
jgi:hypothetical protein